jgi:CBS domain containing-hemolysin-like protein
LDESHSGKKRSFSSWFKSKMGLERSRLEIQQVLDESEERGLIDPDEGEMIEGIFDLKETVAREIMIPRTHLVAIPKDTARDQVLSTIIKSGHSRIPVYDQNVDHIIGVIYAKDLLPLWLKDQKEFAVEEICREAYFVPETKPVKDLLNELRTKKSHLAVIVDEYGGTSGIVTIEDIVEEIIGEIRDEYDTEEDPFLPQDDGTVMVSARANLDDFEERFQVELPRGAYDTLGGYIINILGRVPSKDEEILIHGLLLRIHGGDRKRITRVMVSLASEVETASTSTYPEPRL